MDSSGDQYGQHKCDRCSQPLSLERGVTRIDGGTDTGIYHTDTCHPNPGAKSYTLSDLRRMKEDNAAARAEREIHLMNTLGPNVYFLLKGY